MRLRLPGLIGRLKEKLIIGRVQYEGACAQRNGCGDAVEIGQKFVVGMHRHHLAAVRRTLCQPVQLSNPCSALAHWPKHEWLVLFAVVLLAFIASVSLGCDWAVNLTHFFDRTAQWNGQMGNVPIVVTTYY